MEQLRNKAGFICDMDGVIYHGNQILPGVREFVDLLQRENKHFMFLKNSSHSDAVSRLGQPCSSSKSERTVQASGVSYVPVSAPVGLM